MLSLHPAEVVRRLIRLVNAWLGTVARAPDYEVAVDIDLRVVRTRGELGKDIGKPHTRRQADIVRLSRLEVEARVPKPQFVEHVCREHMIPRGSELLCEWRAVVAETGQSRAGERYRINRGTVVGKTVEPERVFSVESIVCAPNELVRFHLRHRVEGKRTLGGVCGRDELRNQLRRQCVVIRRRNLVAGKARIPRHTLWAITARPLNAARKWYWLTAKR